MSDHTLGGPGQNGKMMVVNGATSGVQKVWGQLVPVTTNTTYVFSVWVSTAVGGGPAVLELEINGATQGAGFSAPTATGSWIQMSRVWNSGANTTADLALYDTNVNSFPNDYYIDDVSLEEAITTICNPGLDGVIGCPCSNPPSGAGRGCNNFGPNPPGGTGGAVLQATGLPSIGTDTLQFQVTDEVTSVSGITVLWQGAAKLPAGVRSGAGVRCVSTSLVRVYKGNAVAGAIGFPRCAQPDVHTSSSSKGYVIDPPITLYYYAAYRNVGAGTPCGNINLGFNTTNGLQVSWAP